MTHDAPTSTDTGTVAVAWYGRVASGDPMDAAVSLRQQADACRRALPDGFHIVAWFYDALPGTPLAIGSTDEAGHPSRVWRGLATTGSAAMAVSSNCWKPPAVPILRSSRWCQWIGSPAAATWPPASTANWTGAE